MNGFGQNPFRISSFQMPSGMTEIERSVFPQRAMAGLQSSLAYRQAGGEGRQRMETLVGMGLPAQTDISKVRAEGMGAGGVPRFSAPRPLPFGSYSGFGPTEEPPVSTPVQTLTGVTQAPSLTQATELRETELGTTGQPLAFTRFGQMARNQKADQYQTPVGRGLSASGMQIPSTGFGDVSLRFPFAGAESAFERTTRTTNTFGGLPMFPSSRFGGPQPAKTMGPVETQPRRSWMY